MTYVAKETSIFEGYPIELYTFTAGVNSWRYTSNDENKTINLINFTAVPIKRSKFEQNQEMSRAPITITMDKDVPFLLQFRGSPPTTVIQVVVQRYHENDTDSQLITPWVGRVVNVKFTETEAELRCEPVYTSMKRPVLRRRYQTTCPHILYSTECGANSAPLREETDLISVSGTSLTASAFGGRPDGHFSGGYVDWESGGVVQRRFILSHTGSTIVVNLPFRQMPNNAHVTAYAGCDHLLNTCDTKFANSDNYGGQTDYPDRNPMAGSPAF